MSYPNYMFLLNDLINSIIRQIIEKFTTQFKKYSIPRLWSINIYNVLVIESSTGDTMMVKPNDGFI